MKFPTFVTGISAYLTVAQEAVATNLGDAVAAKVDVFDEASVQGLLDQATRSFGREAGVLANIAGIGSITGPPTRISRPGRASWQ